MKKIVLTGASGALGHELRATLSARCDALLSVDLVDLKTETLANETFVKADVAELGPMLTALEDADAVVHFAAIPDERPFETLLGPNFIGAYNIWEAAHQNGVRRVVYASSIHAVGMYAKTDHAGLSVPHRPDSFYGLAKCFAEDLGRMYWEKRGIESVHLRICSCTPKPGNARALGTWLSYADLRQLVTRSLDTPTVEFAIVYGFSNNDRAPLDNSAASFLGYRPKDNAEDYAAEILAGAPYADPENPGEVCVGGPFASVPLGESGVAGIQASASKP
ncbi:MAG: NAD(P)-dependent oxidoreductase, partial [Pseudomonadota bacterium]